MTGFNSLQDHFARENEDNHSAIVKWATKLFVKKAQVWLTYNLIWRFLYAAFDEIISKRFPCKTNWLEVLSTITQYSITCLTDNETNTK